MDDPHGSAKLDWKPRVLVLLPTGTNRASYISFIEKSPDAETRNKLEEMLQAGDFAGVQEVLKRSLTHPRYDSTSL